MAKEIDPKIIELAISESEMNPVDFFKRFLDDIFLVYNDTIENLHSFLAQLNCIHPTIKFTMSHTTPPNVETPECGCMPTISRHFL